MSRVDLRNSPATDAAVEGTKRALVERLKRSGGLTAAALARELGVTEAAIRQHLDALSDRGLVERRTRTPSGRGRPPSEWWLTDLAQDLFPDRHADLTVQLLASIREAAGEEGLDRVIAARTKSQLAEYRERIDADTTLPARVQLLADVRTAEGYMAEARADGDDVLLVEHHCPVCEAATECQGLCRSELELFQDVLGPDAEVTREQHLLSGDARCTYRIRPRSPR